ncbi:MAG: tRNA epoxyqueuosine(34) reductase QueG [Mucinivorans sp.]
MKLFDDISIIRAEILHEQGQYMKLWLQEGRHGTMHYMERERSDLRVVMPTVRSAVVTLTSYNRGQQSQPPGAPPIARYAWGADYHPIIRGRLHQLLAQIQLRYPQGHGRAIVDTAPALEKAWAARANLGFIGRNSLLVSPTLGSFTHIGMLLTDLEYEQLETIFSPKEPLKVSCGTCRRCLEGCPTGAILPSGGLDARQCLAYLTIESREPYHGQAFYGCDRCQSLCPYNRAAPRGELLEVNQELVAMTLKQWRELSPELFEARFGTTPLKRVGLERLRSFLE